MIPMSARATLAPALIIDMDGTLCDVRSIRHHLQRNATNNGQRDFRAFHSASIDCPPNHQVAALAREVSSAGLQIVIVTARENKWSFHTALWLYENKIEYTHMLMRSKGDYRPDVDIKREIATQVLKKYNPLLAVDDRDDIIEVWRERMIPTLKVREDGSIDQSQIPPALKRLLRKTVQ